MVRPEKRVPAWPWLLGYAVFWLALGFGVANYF